MRISARDRWVGVCVFFDSLIINQLIYVRHCAYLAVSNTSSVTCLAGDPSGSNAAFSPPASAPASAPAPPSSAPALRQRKKPICPEG